MRYTNEVNVDVNEIINVDLCFVGYLLRYALLFSSVGNVSMCMPPGDCTVRLDRTFGLLTGEG